MIQFYINDPSKEDIWQGMRQRKIGDWDLRILFTFIGRNLSRCKQTLGKQADHTYIQPPIYTDMCTLYTS